MLGGGGGEGAAPPAALAPPAAGSKASASASSSSAPSIVQNGGVRVSLGAGIGSRAAAPPGIAGIDLDLAAAGGGELPQLRRVKIDFNHAGKLHPGVVPSCLVNEIQPATTAAAGKRAAARSSAAGPSRPNIRLPRRSPFPAKGKVLVFNGRFKGHPSVLAHVYGPRPVPTSFTLPFTIGTERGTFETVLRAALPEATGNAAAITGLTLSLGRSFVSHGHRRH